MKKNCFIVCFLLFCIVIADDLEDNANKANAKEVFVDEGIAFILHKNDAQFAMFGNSYVLIPLSQALKNFISQQNSKLKIRTLRSGNNTTQIYSQGKEILFYYSGIKGADLYNKIAPKNFKLIPQTHIDEINPSETTYFYKIEGFDKAILHSPCHIVQNKHFIQDRARGEMLINPDSDINPKLASQKPIELILKCEILD